MNASSSPRRMPLSRLRNRLSSQRSRMWYAAGVAIVLTALTCWVGWCMISRVRDLAATVPRQIQDMKTLSLRLTATGQKTLADAAAHYREHLDAERQLGRFEADEHAAMAKAISDLGGFEETLGRPIRVIPGPPPKYDPGEEPTYPWLPDRFAWWISRDYFNRWNTWYAAKKACDALNNAESNYGSSLAAVREKYRRTREELEACKAAASAAIGSLSPEPGDQPPEGEGRESVSALDAALRWSDLVGREAWGTSTKTAFCLLDIPTFFACLAMTAVAWSRLLLACGWLGLTRITR